MFDYSDCNVILYCLNASSNKTLSTMPTTPEFVILCGLLGLRTWKLKVIQRANRKGK